MIDAVRIEALERAMVTTNDNLARMAVALEGLVAGQALVRDDLARLYDGVIAVGEELGGKTDHVGDQIRLIGRVAAQGAGNAAVLATRIDLFIDNYKAAAAIKVRREEQEAVEKAKSAVGSFLDDD